jgi:AraC-like DNA-binding protein
VLPLSEIRASVDKYLDECFNRETTPRVKELSAYLGLSTRRLREQFWTQVGSRIGDYLRSAQIAEAVRLLRDTDASLNAVAYRCGFSRRASFFRAFHRVTGTTPASHRQSTSVRRA